MSLRNLASLRPSTSNVTSKRLSGAVSAIDHSSAKKRRAVGVRYVPDLIEPRSGLADDLRHRAESPEMRPHAPNLIFARRRREIDRQADFGKRHRHFLLQHHAAAVETCFGLERQVLHHNII